MSDNTIFSVDVYFYQSHKSELLTGVFTSKKVTEWLRSYPSAPIESSRVRGYLNLNDGNGTLKVNLHDLRFSDSGIFGISFISVYGLEIFNNVSLDVQSNFYNFYITLNF